MFNINITCLQTPEIILKIIGVFTTRGIMVNSFIYNPINDSQALCEISFDEHIEGAYRLKNNLLVLEHVLEVELIESGSKSKYDSVDNLLIWIEKRILDETSKRSKLVDNFRLGMNGAKIKTFKDIKEYINSHKIN